MRDLIFVSLENWDEIWRRNQFLCAAWARRFPSSRILFVGQPELLPLRLKNGTLASLRARIASPVAGFSNITSTFIPKPLFNPLPGGRALNELAAQKHIARLARKCELRDPLLWLNPNDAGHLIGRLGLGMGDRGVVYDITDDWELAAPDAATRRSIATRDRMLCRRADLTVVCSGALFESRKASARRLLLLPNGVDAEHYEAASTYDPAKRKGCRWPGRVFGYTGTLHPERIDLELLVTLARAFPRDSVVLVGPDEWKDDTLQKAAREVPNLHVFGAVAYSQLAQVMACFDVCIVPHRQTPFMESLNPIKLWEYLAVGKPIISTNVAGFRDYSDLCRIASSHKEFCAACRMALEEAALGENAEPALARRAEARRHSWEARLDSLLESLRQSHLLEPRIESGITSSSEKAR